MKLIVRFALTTLIVIAIQLFIVLSVQIPFISIVMGSKTYPQMTIFAIYVLKSRVWKKPVVNNKKKQKNKYIYIYFFFKVNK